MKTGVKEKKNALKNLFGIKRKLKNRFFRIHKRFDSIIIEIQKCTTKYILKTISKRSTKYNSKLDLHIQHDFKERNNKTFP